MESLIRNFLLKNRQQKLLALSLAIIIWLFIDHSITEIKVIPNVPVRIVNIPSEHTVRDLLPNGYLSHRVTLTISGSKNVVRKLESGDLEILLDATSAHSDNWIVKIVPKNLVSLNPAINLHRHIFEIQHPEFIIHFSQLVTEKVPIQVKLPLGELPKGYEYLDIWPTKLNQTLSGPEEAVLELSKKGLQFLFDLSQISSEDLAQIKSKQNPKNTMSYAIPKKWKKIAIPFQQDVSQTINDPEAKFMEMHFIKRQLLPLNTAVPVRIHYSPKLLNVINPSSIALDDAYPLSKQNEILLFIEPLYFFGVTQNFLDVVQDNLELQIIAATKEESEVLRWSLVLIDKKKMENIYVAMMLSEQNTSLESHDFHQEKKEILRKRFQKFAKRLFPHKENGQRLRIIPRIEDDVIRVSVS